MPASKFSQSINLGAISSQLGQAAKRAGLQQLPIDSIQPNPHQPRKEFDPEKLQELADSLRQDGQIQPIRVRALGPDRYQLVAGERRWRAATLAGWTHIDSLVGDDKPGTPGAEESDAVKGLIENLHREDLTPVDEIVAVGNLVTRIGVERTAQRLAKNPAWVSKRNRIATAPDFVLAFVRAGDVRDLEALYELAKLADDDADQAKAVLEAYTPGQSLRLRDQIRGLSPARQNAQPVLTSVPAEMPDGNDGDASDADPDDGADGKDRSPEFRQRNSSGNAPSQPGRSSSPRDPDAAAPAPNSKAAPDKPPMLIQAAVKRAGRIILMTDLGQVPCELSERARADLRKLLDA
jgi:ParB/RepB/Spo0J family partition protein